MTESNNQAIEKILTRAEDLKVFPAAAVRIREVADNPDSSLLDMEEAVSSDAALSAQVLKVANSPFYGLRREVGSVQRALFVLGFEATRNMALALAMLSMKRSVHPIKAEIAKHSMKVGIAARQLAQELGDLDVGEMFVAGMLHDLGKLILFEVDEEKYLEIDGSLHFGRSELLQTERDQFSFDHASLGSACLERWNLPKTTYSAIRFHHEPNQNPDHQPDQLSPPLLIWLSDKLEHAIHGGQIPDVVAERLSSHEWCQAANIDKEILAKTGENLANITDPFNAIG